VAKLQRTEILHCEVISPQGKAAEILNSAEVGCSRFTARERGHFIGYRADTAVFSSHKLCSFLESVTVVSGSRECPLERLGFDSG